MILINPDCRDQKHRACDGRGWDVEFDAPTSCPCSCHGAVELAGKFRREIGGVYEAVAACLERDHAGVVQHGYAVQAIPDQSSVAPVPPEAHDCPTGPLVQKFDGARSAMLCGSCRRIVGYWTPEAPVLTERGDSIEAIGAALAEAGRMTPRPVSPEVDEDVVQRAGAVLERRLDGDAGRGVGIYLAEALSEAGLLAAGPPRVGDECQDRRVAITMEVARDAVPEALAAVLVEQAAEFLPEGSEGAAFPPFTGDNPALAVALANRDREVARFGIAQTWRDRAQFVAGYLAVVPPEVGARRLREVWAALGCEQNPDDFKPSVRKVMWGQALDMIRESTARDTRIYRENQQLEAELLALRAAVPPEVDEGLDDGYIPREHEARARFIAGSIEIIRRRNGHTPGEAECVAAAEWDRWRARAAVPPVTSTAHEAGCDPEGCWPKPGCKCRCHAVPPVTEETKARDTLKQIERYLERFGPYDVAAHRSMADALRNILAGANVAWAPSDPRPEDGER